jgi:hypothetical protein
MPLTARARFALLILLGVALRALLIATSIGTNDVLSWMSFARLVDHVGIGPAYARMGELNHPPLSLLILLFIEKLRSVIHLEVGDLLRLTQVGFDLLAVAALVDIGRSVRLSSPYGLALFYFLSPVSVFITGFHGNTDPAMIALLLVSVALLVRPEPRPLLSGVAFALSIGIKIIPLLLLPLLLLWSRDRVRFAAGAVAAGAAIFVPFLPGAGLVMLTRIFGYNTQPGNYGIPYLIASLAERIPRAAAFLWPLASAWISIARYAIVLTVVIYAAVLIRRCGRTNVALLAGLGATLLIVLVLSPGIGMQYFLWPIAFLPFALSRWERLALVGVFALAQFTVYTIWSEGFPWWYADSTIRRPGIDLSLLGNLVWAVMLVAAVRAVHYGFGGAYGNVPANSQQSSSTTGR